MTTVDVVPPTENQPAGIRPRRYDRLGMHVAGVVFRLQSRILRDKADPTAVGVLARLRRGVGRNPGFDYTLEEYLAVPPDLIRYAPPESPADEEHAAHDAVTLYALHQQSQRRPMYLRGNGLGVAVSRLVDASASPEGVRRRFAALGTATTYAETIHHLRGLTMMLREQEIPVDYGLLADDLLTLRRPDGRRTVQAIWGREFYRARAARRPDGATADSTETVDHTPEEN